MGVPAMAENLVISWNTHREVGGRFTATVYSAGYQIPRVTLKTAIFPTREKATGFAKRWTRYLKAEQRRA